MKLEILCTNHEYKYTEVSCYEIHPNGSLVMYDVDGDIDILSSQYWLRITQKKESDGQEDA